MREIKFRAWDKKTQQMSKGDFRRPNLFGVTKMTKETITISNDTKSGYYFDSEEDEDELLREYFSLEQLILDSDRFILMQYTGLKDKNGKEIYESDLLKHERGNIVEVGYADGAMPCYLVYPTKDESNIDISEAEKDWEIGDSECFEVIGNIYENKELLNEQTTNN